MSLTKLATVIAEAQVGFATGERDSAGVIHLRMNNVTTRGGFDWSSITRVPKAAATPGLDLQPDDVVFNNTNSAELVGKSALFMGFAEPVLFSNHFTRLRVRPDQLLPEFLALWLQDNWQKRLFLEICNRWVGQAAIQREKLLSLEIELPDLKRQQEIAFALRNQLAEVERARSAAEARLEAARLLSDAELRRVFEGDEAARWERASLSELLRDRGQYGLSVKTHSDPKGFPVLRMANLSPGEINWSNLKYVELSDSEASKYRLSDGDLLFNRTNSAELVGKTAVFRDGREALFASYLIRFRLKPEAADPDFVCAYVNSRGGRAYIREKMARAIGQVNISASQMVKMLVPVPAVGRQNEIANNLKTWQLRSRELQDEIEVERARLAALPPALLRRAFSGEL